MPQTENRNSLFDLAARFVLYTDCHLFLTGKAGTGKTTFLRQIKEQSNRKLAIVAPTGVAAINAGGVTIHSFFQLPFGAFIPEWLPGSGFSFGSTTVTDLQTMVGKIKMGREKRKLLEELELLIIDEVSMVRADLLDAIDAVLRHFRRKPDLPFGGVQVLYIGDLYQLPPVVKDDEWQELSPYYRSSFFFDARVMEQVRPVYIELEQVYRQTDESFIELLNNIREGTIDEDGLRLLNKRFDPYFHPEPEDGYIILTSHNHRADRINKSELAKLSAEVHQFEGEVKGEFSENALPAEQVLSLKEGAQVMFIRNDKGENRRYYNGKIATVSRIKGNEIYVRFPGERTEMQVEKETWRNIRYQYDSDTEKIKEEELGSFQQYPIRLAWAITIHKSQGLTFEKAIVDAGSSFAPGQVYVALSRMRSMSGLVLSSEITAAALHTNERVRALSDLRLSVEELQEVLAARQLAYLGTELTRSFAWDSVLEDFREFYKGYEKRKLPHQREARQWASNIIERMTDIAATGTRFGNQLRGIIPVAHKDGYQYLAGRVEAASSYFLPLADKLLRLWQEHYDTSKTQTKVKKYLSELELLYKQWYRKRYEIEMALKMAEGLVRGEDPGNLLEKAGAKPVVVLPGQSDREAGRAIPTVSSKEISLNMFREGRSLDDIAAERNLSRSTIEGHLLTYIATGEILPEFFVTAENESVIREVILKSEDRSLSAIHKALSGAYSFTEIKATLFRLEAEEQKKVREDYK